MGKHKFLSFIFIFILEVVAAGGCFWSSGWFVNVANEIREGDKVLVHCKSKDDDIGQHTIGFNQSVHWQFCEKIVSPSTLFFCHFYMGNNEQVFDVFNHVVKRSCVEKQMKDYWRCTWLIKRDGFYFANRTTGQRIDVKMYDWKPMGPK